MAKRKTANAGDPPWRRENPAKAKGESVKMSAEQKHAARERAERTGRRYPNLVDNMAVVRAAKAARKRKRAAH